MLMAEYIKREAILKEIAEIGGHLYSDWETAGVINLVCRQPAADVVPVVHGKWMWELADNGWANWMCSKCGYTRNVDVHVVMDWNYCPYCGARMDGD